MGRWYYFSGIVLLDGNTYCRMGLNVPDELNILKPFQLLEDIGYIIPIVTGYT